MKKNLVLVGTTVGIAICGFLFGNCVGYNNGYDNGLTTGMDEGRYAGRVEYRQKMEDEIRNDIGKLCRYYGIDGITVDYVVTEGNINDEL